MGGRIWGCGDVGMWGCGDVGFYSWAFVGGEGEGEGRLLFCFFEGMGWDGMGGGFCGRFRGAAWGGC